MRTTYYVVVPAEYLHEKAAHWTKDDLPEDMAE